MPLAIFSFNETKTSTILKYSNQFVNKENKISLLITKKKMYFFFSFFFIFAVKC